MLEQPLDSAYQDILVAHSIKDLLRHSIFRNRIAIFQVKSEVLE